MMLYYFFYLINKYFVNYEINNEFYKSFIYNYLMSNILSKPNINLKSTTILNKKFKTHLLGYDAVEVDLFFDQVIADYKTYENYLHYLMQIIDEKNAIIDSKEEQIEKLMIKIHSLEERNNYFTKNSSSHFFMQEINELKKKIDTEDE